MPFHQLDPTGFSPLQKLPVVHPDFTLVHEFMRTKQMLKEKAWIMGLKEERQYSLLPGRRKAFQKVPCLGFPSPWDSER